MTVSIVEEQEMSTKIFYFSSKAGNTKRLVSKLPFECQDVRNAPDDFAEHFILITPTYAKNDGSGAVPPQVKKFLSAHRHKMLGVIGTGNRNFGNKFALAADVIAYKCNVPVLCKVELSGTPSDVSNIITRINNVTTIKYSPESRLVD